MTPTTQSASSTPISLATTPSTAKIERRILDFIRRNDILGSGESVVVAVSGGPDSTALLVALARLSSSLNIKIVAAHLNHMLRPDDETAADLEFVRSLAGTFEIPFAHAAVDVRARSRAERESLEDAARRLRYGFLAQRAQQAGASAVVTGHTIDDQAETVLLHLIRGAGLDGLAGMRPRSPWPFRAFGKVASGEGVGPDLARPLLSLRREETEEYCRELGVTARKDPTNDLPIATRNRLRRDLMPLLRSLNPNIEEAIARLAAAATRDADYLDDLARHHFARIASLGPQTVSFARADLLLAAPALSARLFRLAFAHVTGTHADLEAAHIDALLVALQGRPIKLSLPSGITAAMDSRLAVLRRGEATPAERIPETPLTVPGRTNVAGCVFEANIVPVPAELPRISAGETFLDAEAAGAELNVRSRRAGDRLRPLGLGGEKKLQDILVDAKVPARERDGVPIICGTQGIIWVVGHCIDERYALDPASQSALYLTVRPD